MCIKNFLFPILLFAFKIFCFLSLSCKSGLLLLIYYYFLAILSNVMPDCCIVKFRRKKKYGEDLTKKDLFCLQELFLLLLCFGDSCWLALIKKNFKKINEWNIFIFFFSNWIFLNIPIFHANSTLSLLFARELLPGVVPWIHPGDILSECQPLDALIQHVFYLSSAKN